MKYAGGPPSGAAVSLSIPSRGFQKRYKLIIVVVYLKPHYDGFTFLFTRQHRYKKNAGHFEAG
jgi:hypothetical protein